jgi:hypothetical protein
MQHGMPGRPCAPQMKTGPLPGSFRDEPVADDVDVVYSDSGELSLPFSKNSTSDWYLSYKRYILDSHRHIGVELVMETPNPATYGSKGYQAKITVSLAQTQTVERCGPGHLSGRLLRRRVHEAHANEYPVTVEGGTARYVQRAGARASPIRRAAGPDVHP